MNLAFEKFTIRMPKPFRIAHGTSSTRETILVHLHDPESGLTGHGEGALPPYYPSEAEDCLQWLAGVKEGAPREIVPPKAVAAAVALEIAGCDLLAQSRKQALWRGLSELRTLPACARTISIPTGDDDLCDALEAGRKRGSSYFKLKLGSGDASTDVHWVQLAREIAPEARLTIDANAAWSPETAAEIFPRFIEAGVELIEQPVGREWENWRRLRELLPKEGLPPLIADESIQTPEDIHRAKGLADGINVKLLKARGITGAARWVAEARCLGLGVMIGVMVETGIGRTAAAQFAPQADWLDIDASDAIPMEPMSGCEVVGDRLYLSEAPGLGLVPVLSQTLA